MTSLSNLTKAELYAEIRRRDEEEAQELIRAKLERAKKNYGKLGLLLKLTEHRPGCDEDYRDNDDCSHCLLLRFESNGYWDEDFNLNIRVER